MAATTLEATSLIQSSDNSPRVSATIPRSLAIMDLRFKAAIAAP